MPIPLTILLEGVPYVYRWNPQSSFILEEVLVNLLENKCLFDDNATVMFDHESGELTATRTATTATRRDHRRTPASIRALVMPQELVSCHA